MSDLQLNSADDDDDELHMGPHKSHTVLSQSVSIVYDCQQGRHMCANQPIPAGVLLLRERAFAVTIRRNELAREICHTCIKCVKHMQLLVW